MKKLLILVIIAFGSTTGNAQTQKVELYALIKKLITDSTGFENVGDWGVGNPKKFPVKWKADKIDISPDTAINFSRSGTVDLTINSKSFMQQGQPVKWNIMLKGPRMGYGSFSIVSSPPSSEMHPKQTLDSLFGKKTFTAKLLKSCDGKLAGYHYYEVKIPKKDLCYIRVSWITLSGNTALRIDGYDNFSKYAVKLNCVE